MAASIGVKTWWRKRFYRPHAKRPAVIVKLKPNLVVSPDQAQAIVARVAPGRRVARVSAMQQGEISAVFEIALADGPPAFVLKVYPDDMHWKMQKEITVSRLMEGRLSVPMPRVMLADDSRSLLALNFVVMAKLNGQNVVEL